MDDRHTDTQESEMGKGIHTKINNWLVQMTTIKTLIATCIGG